MRLFGVFGNSVASAVVSAVVFAAAFVLPAFDRPAQADVFGAETFMLGNGMQVVVIPNHRVPIVSHMVWYKVGSADEEPGKAGIAHFLEHLMFKGTPTYPAGEITDLVARNGGQQNAFTSYDYTAYYQNIAVDRLPMMMELEADRMRNLILSEEDVRVERDVVLEERRMRVDSRPASILSERLDAALWVTNRYGTPVIGWEEEIQALNREDAFDFYHRWYAPKNAILVVAGDITLKELRPLAERTYGKIEPVDSVTSRERSTFLPQSADVRVTMEDERVRQARWQRTYVAPSVNVGNREQTYALQVASEILGGGSTSRLYQSLVVDQAVAASAGAYYMDDMVSWGRFVLSISPSPGVEVTDLEAAIDTALADIETNGFTEDEVERAKTRLQAEVIYAKDSPTGAAQTVGSLLAVGLTLEEIEAWPERVADITLTQVNEAIRDLLSESPTGTGILLPKGDV
ncbi:MAG: pitrilysin family protein [Rhodospirillaceae bacterium]